MRLRSILTMLLAGALWVVVPASRTLAQTEIPGEIVERATLTPEDTAVVEKFVNERLPNLANANPDIIKRSRDELLRSFRNPRASVSFRKTFSDKSIAELRKLAGNPKDLVVVNALRVAGEVATTDASQILMEKLNDDRIAVRYAAVSGLERTMMAVANAQPAVTSQRVDDLIAGLGKVVQDGKAGPDIVDAATRALTRAMAITRPSFDGTRPGAFRTLCEGVSKLAQDGAGGPTASVLLRAAQTAQEALAQNGPPMALTSDGLKQAGGLGGQLLSWTFCQIKAGKLPAPGAEDPGPGVDAKREARKTASQIVRVSENIVILSHSKAGGDPIAPQSLGSDIEKGDDKSFIQNLVKVIGPLNGPPFNYPDNAFLKCK